MWGQGRAVPSRPPSGAAAPAPGHLGGDGACGFAVPRLPARGRECQYRRPADPSPPGREALGQRALTGPGRWAWSAARGPEGGMGQG